MCCKNSTGKIIPFLITFAIGIFAASLFYGWTSSNSVNGNRLEKGTNHTRTSCGFEMMKRHHSLMDEVPAVPIAPLPPPAPPIAPPPPPIATEAFEDNVYPPTSQKTIVLRKDLNKKSK